MELHGDFFGECVAALSVFTRAAEQCRITHPALTTAIRALEEEFGGELIRREGKLSHLTDLGRRTPPLLRQCYDSALSAKAKDRAAVSAAITFPWSNGQGEGLAISSVVFLELAESPVLALRCQYVWDWSARVRTVSAATGPATIGLFLGFR